MNLPSRHDKVKVLQILFPHSKETKRQSSAGAPPRFMRHCPIAVWLRLWACTCGKPCSNKSSCSIRCQRDTGESDGRPFWRKRCTLRRRFDTQIKHQSRCSGLQRKRFFFCFVTTQSLSLAWLHSSWLHDQTHEHLTRGLVCRSWSHRWLEAAGNKPKRSSVAEAEHQSHPSLQVVSTQTFNLSELSYVC